MKYVITLIKSVISPVLVFIIPIIGLMASLMSFLIEVLVVEQLLTLLPGTESIFGEQLELIRNLVAVFVAVVLEMQKLSGSYVLPNIVSAKQIAQIDEQDKSKIASLKNRGNALKWMLFTFSFVCTVFYCTYSLYGKITNEESDVNTHQTISYEEKETEINELDEWYKTEKAKLYDTAAWIDDWVKSQSEYEDADQQYENAQNAFRLEAERRGEYASNEKREQLQSDLDNAKENLETIKNNLQTEAEDIYTSKKKGLADYYQEELSRIEEKYKSKQSEILEINSEDDNPYIKTFLSVLFNMFGTNYPEWLYRLLTIIIAGFIALVLEFIISFVQKFISLKQVTLEKLLTEDETTYFMQVKKQMQSLLGAVLIAVTCAFIYVVSRTIIVAVWGIWNTALKEVIVSNDSINTVKNFTAVFLSFMFGGTASAKLFHNQNGNQSLVKSTIGTILITGACYFVFGLIMQPKGQTTVEEYLINFGSITGGSILSSVKNKSQNENNNNKQKENASEQQ